MNVPPEREQHTCVEQKQRARQTARSRPVWGDSGVAHTHAAEGPAKDAGGLADGPDPELLRDASAITQVDCIAR
jgi:hypothetical protein